MKPLRLFMAVDLAGNPRFSGETLPLNKTRDDARHGWGIGLGKPRVIEVEVRQVRRKATR